MRRYLRRHTDGDALGTVYQKQRHPRRQHTRLGQRIVVVRYKIDRLFLDIGKDFVRDLGEANLGVTHRRRIVAVNRTKISLPVNQRITQRKVLRHSHDRIVDRRIAVRVIFTHHVTDRTSGFSIRLAGSISLLEHSVQHTTVNRLEPVADIGQRAADNYRHRVVEIRPAHLVFDIDLIAFY